MFNTAVESDELSLLLLPDKEAPDYFEILVSNCVTAYASLFSDKLAFDYCGVMGKMRAFVLGDERYLRETRKLKARQILKEIHVIDDLSSQTETVNQERVEEEEYDPRNHNKPRAPDKERTGSIKGMLDTRVKLSLARRELLNLNAAEDEHGEADALNVYFLPVTREELSKMETVEINYGSADADLETLVGVQKEAMPESNTGKMRLHGGYREDVDPYTVSEDGTIEEL
jgi:hypothetical protein